MLDAQDLQAISLMMQQLKSDIKDEIAQNNKEMISQFNAVLESSIVPQIKAIAEGHQLLLERLPNADTVHNLEQRVDVLEFSMKTITDKARA